MKKYNIFLAPMMITIIKFFGTKCDNYNKKYNIFMASMMIIIINFFDTKCDNYNKICDTNYDKYMKKIL